MMKAIGDDIWVVEQDFSMGLVDFGGRMTVLRLSDGSLLLYSVLAIDDELASELETLGPVRHIVAPNAFHYLFVEAARERYGAATIYGTDALAKKRPKLKLDVRLGDETPASWGDTVSLLRVAGAPKMDELVLHHGPSQTLVVCDLVFHIHEAGWFSRLFFRMLGVFGRVQQSPLWRFVLTSDREAAEASLQPLWAWPIRRVIVSHGRIIEGPDAKAQLASGLTWMCASQTHRKLGAGP